MANDDLSFPPLQPLNLGSSSADSTNSNLRNQQLSGLAEAFNGLAEAIEASLIGGQTGTTDGIILVAKGTSARALQPSGVNISSLGSLTSMATDRVLGRDTAGTGPVEVLTLSQVLDFVGSPANGDILFRSGGTWTRLPIGATSEVLTVTGGLPAWEPGGAPSAPQGRLTLTASTPVMTSTASGQTTVRYTPYIGQYVPIYDGTNYVMTDTGGELTQATTDTTKSPAAVTTNSNYDVFVWNDSGTIRATRGPAWTNDTTRNLTLTRVGGFLLNTSSITNGPAASRGTYVGTIRSNGSSTIDWIYAGIGASGTEGRLCVWNMYNRCTVKTFVGDSTNSWTYNSTTWRPSNNSSTMRISFVMGLAEDSFSAHYLQAMIGAAVGTSGSVNPFNGIGYDSTSSPSALFCVLGGTSLGYQAAAYNNNNDIGFHFVQALEKCSQANTCTFFGDLTTGSLVIQSGMTWEGRM